MQNVRTIQNFTGYSFKDCLADVMAGMFRLTARWNERRRALRYLQTLSDQNLSDIGLRRSDILSSVYGQAGPSHRGFED
jgi:uncharacterized protein YjiS (DUF1127 family)